MYQWAAIRCHFSVPNLRKPWNTWINFTEFAVTFMILSSFPIKVKVTTKSLYYENFAKKLNNPFNDKKKDAKHVTDIRTKGNIFKEYFTEQYTLLKNSSVLLINQTFLTQSRITSSDFDEKEIFKIIRALNMHKAMVMIIFLLE